MNLKSNLFFAPLSLACLLGIMACAGSKNSAPPQPLIEATPKDVLYLPPLVLADSLAVLLEPQGWDTARFREEIRKELIFQFRSRGIGITEDTGKTATRLQLNVTGARTEGGLRFGGQAELIKAEGQRAFAIPQQIKSGTQGLERSDPTVDRIREWASAVVTGTAGDPKKKVRRKKNPADEYQPQLFMLF